MGQEPRRNRVIVPACQATLAEFIPSFHKRLKRRAQIYSAFGMTFRTCMCFQRSMQKLHIYFYLEQADNGSNHSTESHVHTVYRIDRESKPFFSRYTFVTQGKNKKSAVRLIIIIHLSKKRKESCLFYYNLLSLKIDTHISSKFII